MNCDIEKLIVLSLKVPVAGKGKLSFSFFRIDIPLHSTLPKKFRPLVRFDPHERPPPVSDHQAFAFWVVAYGRLDCISFFFTLHNYLILRQKIIPLEKRRS